MRRGVAGATTALLGLSMTPAITAPAAVAAPEGQGFTLNASDLRHIFRQIQISEQHAVTATAGNPCGTLVGDGANQIPGAGNGRELPWGLRTVDGSCNNLIPGREKWGAADTIFPRLVPAAPRGGYAANGSVTDTGPRLASNLIVDQSPANPAAVAAAGTSTPAPGDGNTLFIENVATDVGLSAPFNSWFTLFGQFFDHGLDLVTKGGNGTVVMPLGADDPLVELGPDGIRGTGDEARAGSPMLLTRTTDLGDPGNQARNTTTSFVDQNQTYTSHPSHQVFLREYEMVGGRPVETGRLLTAPNGGMATWTDVKNQARTKLGIELGDLDVLDVPLLETDMYGHFKRATNGLPQLVTTAGGLRPGNLTTPVNTTGVVKTGHAFLDDIAHHAVPRPGFTADPDSELTPGLAAQQCQGPSGPPGCLTQYDDEMLGAHFVAGDGRVNENIGLTTVHHVFHAEHNRLRADIDRMINDPATGLTAAEVTAWKATGAQSSWGYGERLFQAARFVTEMEYQHLVFEEFARKVQPMVNLFGEGGTGYHTEVNASIRAEFAHAVYRFGHSMLTEKVDRVRANGTADTTNPRLLDVFLNPPAFMQGYASPEAAAGSVVRGMTRQTANEIDEFVTGALRNNLLGLPLDLASINMARARDTGIPTLNEARRAFFAQSGNTQVRPYESWADLRFSLKHPESLVNFIAAFGRHPSILSQTTITGRRDAADLLVNGSAAGADGILVDDPGTAANEEADNQPADAFEFLNGTGTWANAAGRTVTGVDDIDLWVGGLAEKTMVFGGLLGPTFNFVFEKQMEDLQDGDRFYYLSRTAGLNLLTQLEGNSFAELVMRNTDVEGLPADSFSHPAYVFNTANLGSTGAVLNDPGTEWNENVLLSRMPNGTIRYGGPEHVVFNGKDAAPPGTPAGTWNPNDRIWSSEGDDTIRGNLGNDWAEGGDGNDNLIGGVGDDILTDLSGDDTIKGGAGDDTISSGQGFAGDLNQGGTGNDFVVGGNDDTETFGGEGDDFVFAGDGQDTVFGDGGDDWMEAGRGAFNLLQGDNGAPFADDINAAGHDVLDGDGGEQDYDAEGGDDIMLMGPGIQRAEGMRGYDWATHQGDPLPADSDMSFTGVLHPNVENNRDRFDLVEALSGYEFNDVLRGDNRTAADLTAGVNEPANSHVLNQAGINRIQGLAGLLPRGATSFAGGNILLGGGGGDVIEGRGGDDIIDGDAQLTVELNVPYNDGTPTKIVKSMSQVHADVLAGRVDPGLITIVRRLESPANGPSVDRAVFTEARTNYTITRDGDFTIVAHTGGTGVDGTDRLRNIEALDFGGAITRIDTQGVPDAPAITGVTAGNGQAVVRFAASPDNGGLPVTEFQVRVFEGAATTATRTVTGIAPTASSVVVTGLTNGTPVRFAVVAVNLAGMSQASNLSDSVTPTTPTAPPTGGTGTPSGTGTTPSTGTPPATGTPPPSGAGLQLQVPAAPEIAAARSGARGGRSTATARWSAPAVDGGSAITGYRVVALKVGAKGKVTKVIRSGLVDADRRKFSMRLPEGIYRFRVLAVNAVGTGARSDRSNAVASR